MTNQQTNLIYLSPHDRKTLTDIAKSLDDISQSLRNLDLDSYRLSLRNQLYPEDDPIIKEWFKRNKHRLEDTKK